MQPCYYRPIRRSAAFQVGKYSKLDISSKDWVTAMVCTLELTRFIIYCSLLGILIFICFILLIIYFIATIIIIRNSQVCQTKDQQSDDLKTGSQTPLIFPNRRSRARVSKGDVVTNEFRDNSLLRKEFDRLALEAIYGENYQIDTVLSEEGRTGSPLRGRHVADRANVFENPNVSTAAPKHQLNMRDITRRRTNELSKKFQDDPNVPTGLQLKPGKPEETKEEEPVSVPTKQAKGIKAKKPAKRYKDPPSVFKVRHQREAFLDVEFVDLVDQTNKRLAEYTLAGIEETDVQVFANQHLTEKNIKRSKLEFEKTTFHSSDTKIPTRKTSDHKSMLLTAKSVLDDIDFDLTVKKDASLHSVASRGTEVTSMSHDDLRL